MLVELDDGYDHLDQAGFLEVQEGVALQGLVQLDTLDLFALVFPQILHFLLAFVFLQRLFKVFDLVLNLVLYVEGVDVGFSVRQERHWQFEGFVVSEDNVFLVRVTHLVATDEAFAVHVSRQERLDVLTVGRRVDLGVNWPLHKADVTVLALDVV